MSRAFAFAPGCLLSLAGVASARTRRPVRFRGPDPRQIPNLGNFPLPKAALWVQIG
jgi:hypothetical protein